MYTRVIKNPYLTLLKTFFFKPPWLIILKTNQKRIVLDKKDLFETVYLLNHPLKGSEVRYAVKNTNATVQLKTVRGNDGSEVFEQNIYDWLPVANKFVVDIGASIGDSPLYFASKGAKHVFAYEADAEIFQIAICNIEENSYENLITIENKIVMGCVSHDSVYTEPNKTRVMPVTLDQIVKEHQIKDGVLKIDCEGCEYGVILSASAEILRHFSHIQMEYHFGAKDLKKRLIDLDYDVKVSRNRYAKSPDTGILMKAGDLYATRIGEVNGITK